MGTIFNVNELSRHIATLYRAYTFFETNNSDNQNNKDKLLQIAKELQLYNVVQDRSFIAVAGMQGTGKTRLIRNLYAFPENLLRISAERGEAVPVFITESASVQPGKFRAVKYSFDNETHSLYKEAIDQSELERGMFARESAKKRDTVFLELFTAQKFFSDRNARENKYGFLLLPGFEKSTMEQMDEEYNRPIKVCLQFAQAILLVTDAQNIANNDINTVLKYLREGGFNDNNSVFAITKCDVSTNPADYQRQLKASLAKVLNNNGYSADPEKADDPANAKIICTGSYRTQEENEAWIEKILDAINRFEQPVSYEHSLACYEPIVKDLLRITDDLELSVRQKMYDLQGHEKTSDIYEELLKAKDDKVKKLEAFLEKQSQPAIEAITENIKQAYNNMDPKLLRDKKLLVFKKSVRDIDRDEKELQKILDQCFLTDKEEPVFADCMRKAIAVDNIKKSPLLCLPEANEDPQNDPDQQALKIEQEKKQKDFNCDCIKYYFDPNKDVMIAPQNENIRKPSTSDLAKMMADELTNFFLCSVGKAAVDEEFNTKLSAIKSSDVFALAKKIRNNKDNNNAKTAVRVTAITGALDMLDGTPNIMEAISAGLSTPAGPYVAAAVAVAAVAVGGIVLYNKDVNIQLSSRDAAIRSAENSLYRQRDALLQTYSNAFDNMIDTIERVYRQKKNIGEKQTKLRDAEMALHRIRMLCQDPYDRFADSLSKG